MYKIEISDEHGNIIDVIDKIIFDTHRGETQESHNVWTRRGQFAIGEKVAKTIEDHESKWGLVEDRQAKWRKLLEGDQLSELFYRRNLCLAIASIIWSITLVASHHFSIFVSIVVVIIYSFFGFIIATL